MPFRDIPLLESPSVTSTVDAPGLTILIAKDCRVQAELLRRDLEGAGYHVIAAGNGDEALALSKAQRPAALISDIIMPKMDGHMLCHHLRQDPELCPTPVILLTTLTEVPDVIRGLNAGADCYVTKPYNREYLLSRLVALLDEPPVRDETAFEMNTTIAGVPFRALAGPTQLLNLLVSTYENSVLQNRKLEAAQDALSATARELAQTNAELERHVIDRTAELELARQREHEARETAAMAWIAGGVRGSVTEQTFGVLRLRENAPEFFNDVAQQFERVLEMSLEQRVLRVEHPISNELRAMAEQLGAIKAGPRDAIEIFMQALKSISRDVPPQKARAYAEEGRLLVLQLMGDLVSFYRNYFTGIVRNAA